MRIFEQDRIHLPRRGLEPRDIRPDDRLQIGHEFWRVRQAWPAAGSRGGSFTLAAEKAATPVALLIAPDVSPGARFASWILVKDGQPLVVPGEMIIAYPSGLEISYGEGRIYP